MDTSYPDEPSHRTGPANLPELQAQAERGDAEAQFALGVYFASAGGDLPDFPQAARWYRLAAEQGHLLAQFNLGVMFARGQGLPRDDGQAAVWMRRAAEGGDAGGQYDLGLRCHRASVDTGRSDALESRIEAYQWLQLAAAQGYQDAEIACQRVTLAMTRTEVDEGNHRVAAFSVRKPASAPIP